MPRAGRMLARLGYRFRDENLLMEALTHSSAAQDFIRRHGQHDDVRWNERLEFLGDSVLSLVISSALIDHQPPFTEGELSRIRASLVNERTLSSLSKDMGLGECLYIGKGEEKGGGRKKPSLLADALEALFGAIYIDSDYQTVGNVILQLFRPLLASPLEPRLGYDFKSRLQEIFQARFKEAPVYRLVGKEGPEHDLKLAVEVRFRSRILARGTGINKKSASQDAAMQALQSIEQHPRTLDMDRFINEGDLA